EELRLRLARRVLAEDPLRLRVAEDTRRAGEDEGPHPLRVAERVAETGPPAHRLRDQPHVRDAEIGDQRGEGVDVGVGAGQVGRLAGEAEAAVVEGHARVVVAEVRHLLPPAEVAAAEPVGEHERGPAPVGLVVEPRTVVTLEKGHGARPPAQEAAARARRAPPTSTCATRPTWMVTVPRPTRRTRTSWSPAASMSRASSAGVTKRSTDWGR